MSTTLMITFALKIIKSARRRGYFQFINRHGQLTGYLLSRKHPNLKIYLTGRENLWLHKSSSVLAPFLDNRKNLHAAGKFVKIPLLYYIKKKLEQLRASSKEAVPDEQSFNESLDLSWRERTVTEILAAFNAGLKYAQDNKISMSDISFDKLTNLQTLQLCDLKEKVEQLSASFKELIIDEQSFHEFLDQSWAERTTTEILAAFNTALKYAQDNGISVSDIPFDKLKDGVKEQLENMSEEEISEFLLDIVIFPFVAMLIF